MLSWVWFPGNLCPPIHPFPPFAPATLAAMLSLTHARQVQSQGLWTSAHCLKSSSIANLLPYNLHKSPYHWVATNTKEFIINSFRCNNGIVDYAGNVPTYCDYLFMDGLV